MAKRRKKRKRNMAPSGNFDVDVWRSRQIQLRTFKYFCDQSDQFALEHENDTDDELIDYVKGIALELNRMPRPIEVPGGYYIEQRLGRWLSLAEEFGVAGYDPNTRYREVTTAVYRQEYERQAELFQEERQRKKAEKATKPKKKKHNNPPTESQNVENAAEAPEEVVEA